MAIMRKGLKDYLRDDPTLAEKYTPTEFYGQKAAAPTNNDDHIEEAYENYLKVMEELEKSGEMS